MHKISIVFLSVILFVSCNNNTVVSENISLPGYWNKDEIISFDIPQLDSLKRYHIFINLRNTNEYRYNNLFLIVSMNFPHGKTITDTLEYKMAQPDGTWMGEGIGNLKENKLWYKENISFSEAGNYKIVIKHAVRNNGEIDGVSNLKGISDVGYSIEESLQE